MCSHVFRAMDMIDAIVFDKVAYASRPCSYAESKGCGNVRCSKIAVRGVQCNGTARGMDICKVVAGRVMDSKLYIGAAMSTMLHGE